MTPRSIRHAAERKAKKLARKGEACLTQTEARLAQIPAPIMPDQTNGLVFSNGGLSQTLLLILPCKPVSAPAIQTQSRAA